MNLPPLSLWGKLFVFAALLVLVPGVLLGWLANQSARDSLTTVIGRELAREALHTAERISTLIRTEQRTLQSFARQDLMREIVVGDIDKRVSLALSTLRNGSGTRLGYLVVDTQGSVIAASSPGWIDGGGLWRKHLTSVLHSNAPFFGPIQAGSDRALALATSVPDPDREGEMVGTLIGFVDWTALEALLAGVRADLQEHDIHALLQIVDRNGTPIARAGEPAEPGFAAGIGGLEEPPGFSVDHASGSIVGRARLDVDVPPWRLLIVEPLAHALAPARALTQRIALTTALALAVALVVATVSARRVVHPLSELTEAIQGLAGGDIAGASVPVRSDDEVGLLARSFNQMAGDLARVQRDLVEAEKFAFVGELASGVAHEVRTSLGVLRSSAQLLGKSMADAQDSEVPELVEMIRDEVARLGGVVDDLLTLDRPRGIQPEPTSLSQPLVRAAEFVEPRAREQGVDVSVSLPREDPTVSGDREALQHLCVNLLVNAVQSLPHGGRIELVVEEAGREFGWFRVSDDGPGIPEDLRQRIFEPFMTGRDTGVGLGLTFVKRAVHEHGGRISVDENPGGGACFRVGIPLSEELV